MSVFLLTIDIVTNAQPDCIVTLDKEKGLTTTRMVASSDAMGTYITGTTKRVYKGNPYFNYPVWESGSVWVEGQRQALIGKVAYDLSLKTVYYGVNSTQFYRVKSDQFTLNDRLFVNRSVRAMGKEYPNYYQVLYSGKTITLIKQTTCKLFVRYSPEGYDGEYKQQETYFIQNESGSPKFIKRTRKSVEKALSGLVKSGESSLSLPPRRIAGRNDCSLLEISERSLAKKKDSLIFMWKIDLIGILISSNSLV